MKQHRWSCWTSWRSSRWRCKCCRWSLVTFRHFELCLSLQPSDVETVVILFPVAFVLLSNGNMLWASQLLAVLAHIQVSAKPCAVIPLDHVLTTSVLGWSLFHSASDHQLLIPHRQLHSVSQAFCTFGPAAWNTSSSGLLHLSFSRDCFRYSLKTFL